MIESYVLAPLIQHKAVHLPPATILFAQVLMGAIVGALGVAVATPLAAAVMVAVSMLYVEDAARRQEREDQVLVEIDRTHQALPLVVAVAPAPEVIVLWDLDAEAAALLHEAQVLRRVAEIAVVVAALLPARRPAIGFAQGEDRACWEEERQQGQARAQRLALRNEPMSRSHSS